MHVTPKNILLITSFDSFLKIGVSLCQDIDYSYLDVKIRLTQPNQLSYHQVTSAIGDSKNIKLSCFYHNEIESIDFSSYDVVVLSIGNAFHKFFFNYLNKKNLRKDIFIITLFPGIVFGEYESIFSRIQANILLVNNIKDYHIAKAIKEQYKLQTNIINYGLIQAKRYIRQTQEHERIYYIDQVIVPKTYEHRLYLLEKLIELANQYSNKKFFIKCRVNVNERTVHDNSFPIDSLFNEISMSKVIPSNLTLTYEAIELCLEQASLILTISSTVAIEAMYSNIPVAIVADFGINSSLLNEEFANSGCFTRIDDVFQTDLRVNKLWYERMVAFPENRRDILNECINFEVNHQIQYNKIIFNITLKTYSKSMRSRFKRYLRKHRIITKFHMIILKINIYKFLRDLKLCN